MENRVYEIGGHLVRMETDNASFLDKMGNLTPFRSDKTGPVILNIRQIEVITERYDKPMIVSEEPGFPNITVGKTPKGKWFWEMAPLPKLPVSGRMLCSEDFSNIEFSVVDPSQSLFTVNNVMMIAYAMRCARFNTLSFHSSVIKKDGRGYLFLGKSGTGKSTHSRLWLENIPGCELLNDDNPVVRIQEDGSVTVYGTPWSGKTRCYKAEEVPVGAFVRIIQAPENRITRLKLVPAYASIYPSVSSFRPDGPIAEGLHNSLSAVAAAVPCYNLECLPNAEAAMLCYNTVHE